MSRRKTTRLRLSRFQTGAKDLTLTPRSLYKVQYERHYW